MHAAAPRYFRPGRNGRLRGILGMNEIGRVSLVSFRELKNRLEPNPNINLLRADFVLKQARLSISKLDNELGDPSAHWYSSYVAAVVLLRSVGHVVIPPFLTGFDRRTHSAVCSLSF